MLSDLKFKGREDRRINGHWSPIWRLCPVCLLDFSVYARAENILEDEKYYKKLSKLEDKTLTEGDGIDHGNERKINKCELQVAISSLTTIYYFISVTSLEFWKQVKRKNIDELEATYAYKHDFELFGYSIKDYLKKIKYSD